MSAGQITTALAFVISGFVQMAIEKELTPIPNYGSENSLQVLNGIHNYDLTVSSAYWEEADCQGEEGVDCQVTFDLEKCSTGTDGCEGKMWRSGQVLGAADSEGNPTTEGTFSWIREKIPENVELEIIGEDENDNDVIILNDDVIHHEEISSILFYRNHTDNQIQHMKVQSEYNRNHTVLFSIYHNKKNHLHFEFLQLLLIQLNMLFIPI